MSCTYCKKLYSGETGRPFARTPSRRKRNDKDASKPVARHFNLRNHSQQHTAVCGLCLHLGGSESRKTLEKNLSSKSAFLIPTVSTSPFHSTNLSLFFRHYIPTNSVAPFSAYKPTHSPQFLY